MGTIDFDELMKQAEEAEKQLLEGMPEEQQKILENAEKLICETMGVSSVEEMLKLSPETLMKQAEAFNARSEAMLRERMGDETFAEMMALEKQMREESRNDFYQECYENSPADTKLAEAIKKVTRNAVYFDYETDISEIPCGNTKFGGRPDVPSDFEWLRAADGRPLAFLAQFNLSELEAYDISNELPKKGMLYFFYDLEDMPWDSDDGGARVYYSDNASELSPADFPEDICEECIVEECALKLEAVNDAPQYEDFDFVSESQCDDYGTYLSSVKEALGFAPEQRGDIRCKLLGYSDIIQNSVLEEFAFNDENDDWTLLAQFDTYENGSSYIMYCDGGRIYFGIRKQDLAAGNFDNIKLILQCF
ncbi:MAG: DUF1963 domain-containing protein [Oscillospiraceae bacterium]|nr:DUF1963 domain-containing protein [Oscillospiraceae bacterium]